MRRRLVARALLPLAIAACDGGDASSPSPAPVKSAPASTAAGPKRTIEVRSPFGDTAARGNVMVDGDFELTGRTGQMGWLALDANGGQRVLDYATGGRCRSGIRCARVAPGDELLGYLASPKDGDIHVVIRVKPHAVCAEAAAVVVDVDDPTHAAPIGAAAPLPDASGWCRFEGETPNFARLAPALFIQVDPKAGGDVLIDDVVATAVPSPSPVDGGARDGGATTRAFSTLPAGTAARVRAIGAWLKARRRLDHAAGASR